MNYGIIQSKKHKLEMSYLDSYFKENGVDDYGFICIADVLGNKATIQATPQDRFYAKTITSVGKKAKEIIAFAAHVVESGARLDIVEEKIVFSPQEPVAAIMKAQEMVATAIRSSTTSKMNAKRKQEGLPVGRQGSKNETYRLDNHADDIIQSLKDGESKTSLKTRLGVTHVTLNRWLKRHGHMPQNVGSPSQITAAQKAKKLDSIT